MKSGLCLKIAVGNIKKNYRFFIPRILAETGLLACFYIIFTLAMDGRLAEVKGGEYIPTFMWMGSVVIALLSVILMLYINSFLMKQRKREFGLYNVLGMEKRHIGSVLFYESFFSSAISIILGLAAGVLFYKLSSLLICKLLAADIVIGFYFITPKTLIPAALAFALIDILTYLINRISISRMKPVELLVSNRLGEKEPKVKWLLLIVGILALGGGYYIALTTESPLEALYLFFAAVILVIIGTYCLFITGSIFVLKLLKKKEHYYYNKKHMASVSGLLYRMKQNAVGLASIAILATGVLVMLSTTVCLYSQMENTLKTTYSYHYYVSAEYYDENNIRNAISSDVVKSIVEEAAEKHHLEIKQIDTQDFLDVSYLYRDGELISDLSGAKAAGNLSELCTVTFITEETYKNLGGDALNLKKNEAAVCTLSFADSFTDNSFILNGKRYEIAKSLSTFPVKSAMVSANCYGIVVAEQSVLETIYQAQKEAYGVYASEYQSRICVNFTDEDKAFESGYDFSEEVFTSLRNYMAEQAENVVYFGRTDSIWQAREAIYGMYGTLLFLGILLGMVCLFATVLIIYYKQVSEGYEDRNRFQIMQKIGMCSKEAKKTIRSQILMVFFLPLIVAGVHIAFAYPILTKLLKILLLTNRWLLLKWILITYVVFALVYAMIYSLTAKTYYKIVY